MTFQLTILGSSSAIPTSEKYPTAQVLKVHERFFLIDCGEGTQIRLRKFRINFSRIRHIFISHLHGDHFFGLPGFILTRNLLGIKSDIHIFAHQNLEEMLDPLLKHLKGELSFRINFYPLNFRDPEKIISDKDLDVVSFPLRHSVPCCGFLFREKEFLPSFKKEKIKEYNIPLRLIQSIKEGADFLTSEGILIPHSEMTMPPPAPRSYAFCTDTAIHEPITEIIKDVDLLYHEATFLDDMEKWASQTLHSTARQAASLALKANAKKLILGHFSTRYKDLSLFLREAVSVFPDTELAADGACFGIPLRKPIPSVQI